MRFQTWSDVFWLGTGADYAKANRFVVLDLQFNNLAMLTTSTISYSRFTYC